MLTRSVRCGSIRQAQCECERIHKRRLWERKCGFVIIEKTGQRHRVVLYGHPGAGSCWEAWNVEKMKSNGFRAVDGWPGCDMHPRNGLFMTVRAEDFTLVGPTGGMKSMRKRVVEHISIEPPTPMERHPVCTQRSFENKDQPRCGAREDFAGQFET